MTYRDEGDAWLAKRAGLVQAIAEEADLTARELRTDELVSLDRARRVEARRKLPVLANARIASPCHEPFEAMTGDGAIRNCARCDREVFDVARMTLAEAEALVTARACVRLTKRRDGTMMFADCEVGARGVRGRRLGALVAGVVVAGTAVALAVAPRPLHSLRDWNPLGPPTPVRPISTSGVHYVHEMGQMRQMPMAPESAGPVSSLGPPRRPGRLGS